MAQSNVQFAIMLALAALSFHECLELSGGGKQMHGRPLDDDGTQVWPSAEDDLLDPEMNSKNSEQVPPMEPVEIRSIYKRMDLNGDQRINVEEAIQFAANTRIAMAKQGAEDVFEHYDKDGDGKLSHAEALAVDLVHHATETKEEHQQRVELESEKFKAADVNGDDFINTDELHSLLYPETNDRVLEIATREKMLEKDKDGSNALTKEEFWFSDYVDPEYMPEITPGDHTDFEVLDKDNNGLIDLQELKVWEAGSLHEEKAVRGLIKLADKDADGFMTLTEMIAAREDISENEVGWFLHHWEMYQEGNDAHADEL